VGVLLGLTTAFAYGIADFLARFSTRRVGVAGSLIGALLAGSVVLSVWLLLAGQSGAALLRAWPWLVLSGLLSFGMLGLLYASLARGPIAVASPVVSVHPALVALWLYLGGTRPTASQWLGLGITVLGGVGLGAEVDRAGAAQGLPPGYARTTGILAALAALVLSFQILSIQHAAALAGPLAAAWGSRCFALLAALLTLPLTRRYRQRSPAGFVLSMGQGLLDVLAVLALAAGSSGAARAIVPVIGSGFSAVTVVLARFLLAESMSWRQWACIATVIVGVAILGAS
jgi:drug/metabolite transporter (DMT)-like permease